MAAQGSDQGLTLPEVAMAPNEWAQKAMVKASSTSKSASSDFFIMILIIFITL